MEKYFLHDDVTIKVVYDDRSMFGSPMSHRTDWMVRELFAPVLQKVEQQGYQSLETAPELGESIMASEAFAAFFDMSGKEPVIRDEVIYPDVESVTPEQLFLVREKTQQKIDVEVPEGYWPSVHELLAKLQLDGVAANDPSLSDEMQVFLSGMIEGEFVFLSEEDVIRNKQINKEGITFLGHNTVLFSTKSAKILIDPLLFPTSGENPENYQPMQVREFGKVDGILITHSHPDHFDPGSLLRFPADTLIVVPRCDQETILSAAMEYRLKELGFTNVRVLDWWNEIKVGDTTVHSLPFYGEQPTDGKMLNSTIRNEGNTYLVRSNDLSSLFLADSGCDGEGNIIDLALQIRERVGKADIAFSGYRGWIVYPFQYLFSSVARYLLFVPPTQWAARQQIMTTADQALDIAERVGAKYLVPYADGGAPWHWKIELGPKLDGNGKETEGFDYFPERVSQVAENRTELLDGSMMKSSVKTVVVRPNETISIHNNSLRLEVLESNQWPYAR